jgi:hypothetical protein
MGAWIGGPGFRQTPSTGGNLNRPRPVQPNSLRRTMAGGPVMPRLLQNPYAQFSESLRAGRSPLCIDLKLKPGFSTRDRREGPGFQPLGRGNRIDAGSR